MIHGITLGNVNYQLEINSTYDTVYPETYPAGRGSFELIDLCLLAANRRSPVLPARTSRETAAAPSRIEDCRPSLAPQACSLRGLRRGPTEGCLCTRSPRVAQRLQEEADRGPGRNGG